MRMLLVVMALMISGPLLACSCLKLSLDEYYQQADKVFIGQIVSVEAKNKFSTIAKIQVQTAYKGVSVDLIELQTSSNSASCGISFNEGELYLVFAGEKNTAGLCSGTRSYPSTAWGDSEQDVEVFLKNLPSKKLDSK